MSLTIIINIISHVINRSHSTLHFMVLLKFSVHLYVFVFVL